MTVFSISGAIYLNTISNVKKDFGVGTNLQIFIEQFYRQKVDNSFESQEISSTVPVILPVRIIFS